MLGPGRNDLGGIRVVRRGGRKGTTVHVDGRVALVTGASSGIGRATATLLAERGTTVLVHGRDRQRTDAVARLTGGTPLLCDLSVPGAAAELAGEALGVHGRVDLLVANAGMGLSAPLTEIRARDVDRLLTVDLAVPIHLIRVLLPQMVERGTGHVVLVGSVAGRTGVAGEAVYAAAKAGLDVFAESLRLELHGSCVGVTLVLPGIVETSFFADRGGTPARRFPRSVTADAVAERLVDGVESNRAEVWVPSWLRVSSIVRAATPGLFHGLSARFGEQVRIRPGRGSTR
jgi:short-subunit dehydrogenase